MRPPTRTPSGTLGALLLVVVVAVSVVAPGATGAAGAAQADPFLLISDVTVEPGQPGPDELVTVTATIRNLPQSSGPLNIQHVALRGGPDGETTYANVTELGDLPPDTAITVPLTTRFAETGTKNLRIHVHAEERFGDEHDFRYPVVVSVRDTHPGVDLDVADPVAGVPRRAVVNVSNGLESEIRNVDLRLSGDGVSVRESRVSIAGLASGATERAAFTLTATEPGARRLTATLRYTTGTDTRRRVERNVTVDFEPLVENVRVRASPTDDGGGLAVTVTNLGNAPVTDVTVLGSAADATVSEAFLDGVPARSSRTARLNVSGVEGETEVTATASYSLGDRTGEVRTTAVVEERTASIELTGVNVRREAGTVHVSGSASNVGGADATSVVVGAVDTDAVTPAYPARTFFVGSVPASDFVSFDVYATVDGETATIPVRVTYRVDGTKRERVVDVPYEGGATGETATASPLDGRAVWIGGGLGMLLVAGFIAFAWRNRDGSR